VKTSAFISDLSRSQMTMTMERQENDREKNHYAEQADGFSR
jgi:hypothetical protein